jgi:pimeloyl-ACP methyl ester carboxylesterase
MQDLLKTAAPRAEAILASPQGRRRATQDSVTNFEHIPVELLAHQMRGAASCDAVFPLIDHATREGWSLDAEKITCPVRVVWGTDDRLLSWPSAAARYRDDWLPHADWVELEGIGHCPQLDVPLETAQVILGFTGVERELPVSIIRPRKSRTGDCVGTCVAPRSLLFGGRRNAELTAGAPARSAI